MQEQQLRAARVGSLMRSSGTSELRVCGDSPSLLHQVILQPNANKDRCPSCPVSPHLFSAMKFPPTNRQKYTGQMSGNSHRFLIHLPTEEKQVLSVAYSRGNLQLRKRAFLRVTLQGSSRGKSSMDILMFLFKIFPLTCGFVL